MFTVFNKNIFSDLGNAEVKVLADYFCTCLERVGVVVGNLSQDWMTLKTLLYEK